jgi:hypothetical protein
MKKFGMLVASVIASSSIARLRLRSAAKSITLIARD